MSQLCARLQVERAGEGELLTHLADERLELVLLRDHEALLVGRICMSKKATIRIGVPHCAVKARAGGAGATPERGKEQRRTRVRLVHGCAPAAQRSIREDFGRPAREERDQPRVERARPGEESRGRDDAPHGEPVALVPLDALVVAAPSVGRLAPDKAVEPDREPSLLVEGAQEAHVGGRERCIVNRGEAVLEHREGGGAEEGHARGSGPGRDDSGCVGRREGQRRGRAVRQHSTRRRRSRRTDEGHGVIEEDAARATVGASDDLAAGKVDRQVGRKEGEDGRRDPETVHVDCCEPRSALRPGRRRTKKTHCA